MHRNARLTLWGRQELVRRINAGTPIDMIQSGTLATTADQMSKHPFPY